MAVIDPLVFEARVRSGARFMDERHPGWHTKISLDELAMHEGTSCIIGQTYGSYMDGVMTLTGSDAVFTSEVVSWETRHGFNLSNKIRHRDWDITQESWDLLRKLWEVQIQERLIADMD